MKTAATFAAAVAAACTCLTVAAQQPAPEKDYQLELTLRAADEPAAKAKEWDRGATLAYHSINGNATVQADLVLKLSITLEKQRKGPDGRAEPQRGAFGLTIEPGVYLHKNNSSTKPQNDRGASVSAGWHILGFSTGAGSVVSYDLGAAASAGKTLKQGSGAAAGQYFDAESARLVGTASVFYRPSKGRFSPESWTSLWSHYGMASLRVYSDRVSGAQNASANGTVSGTAISAQYSIAPLGTDPASNGYGIAPILTLQAQRQRDSSANGGRTKGSRSLYALGASFPFRTTDGGATPSIEVQRSVGADILQGREDRGETRIAFGLKF